MRLRAAMRGFFFALLLGATAASAQIASLKFRPQSTGLCALLPGGRVRMLPYGVGGNVGYVLMPGFDIASGARDFRCQANGPLVLGPRGDLAYVSSEEKRPYAEVVHVEPHATRIALLGGNPCVVLDTGKLVCARTYDGKVAWAQPVADALAAAGQVEEILPDTMCGRMRDGRILCGQPREGVGLTELWTGVKQASLPGGSHGCVAKLDGTVECIGDNRYGQRGIAPTTKVRPDAPNPVPGLTGIVEVAASGTHACARNEKGEVWCWGRADEHQLGEDGFDDAEKIPVCELDREAMQRQRDALEDFRKRCAQNKPPRNPNGPPHDDPCGRALWNYERSGSAQQNVYKETGACEIAQHPVRFHPAPVRVTEVKDAIALAVGGAMSCALTKQLKLVCWGGDLDAPKSMQIPPSPVVPPPPPAPPRPVRPAISAALNTGVCVRTAAGALTLIPVDAKGNLGTPAARKGDAVDLLCLPLTVCERARDGSVACATHDGNPPFGGVPLDETQPGALTAMFGFPCVLRADGVARCGPGFGSQNQTTRVANALSAVGPITDLAGYCAAYDDGALRCLDAQHLGTPPPVVMEGVASIGGWWGLMGQAGCAAMKDGTLRCSGTNSHGQRGVPPGEVKPDAFNTVEGLTDVAEVAVSSGHACARLASGTVWCWGRTVQGETGKAARARATELPPCPTDPKTKYAIASEGCQYPGNEPVLFNARPTQVAGVEGAIAIAATPGLSCALLADAVACWGGGNPAVRTVKLPR